MRPKPKFSHSAMRALCCFRARCLRARQSRCVPSGCRRLRVKSFLPPLCMIRQRPLIAQCWRSMPRKAMSPFFFLTAQSSVGDASFRQRRDRYMPPPVLRLPGHPCSRRHILTALRSGYRPAQSGNQTEIRRVGGAFCPVGALSFIFLRLHKNRKKKKTTSECIHFGGCYEQRKKRKRKNTAAP